MPKYFSDKELLFLVLQLPKEKLALKDDKDCCIIIGMPKPKVKPISL